METQHMRAEDAEDLREAKTRLAAGDAPEPWEKVKKELGLGGELVYYLPSGPDARLAARRKLTQLQRDGIVPTLLVSAPGYYVIAVPGAATEVYTTTPGAK